MTGTALAQDPPEGDPAGTEMGGEVGGEMGGETTTDPAVTDPAAPPAEPMTAAGGKGSKTVGVDVAGVLPLSDYGDAADFAIGALGRFEFGVNDMLSITGRVGFLYHIGAPEGFSLLMIPVFAGVKYDVGTSGLFAFGELGLNYTRVSVDFMGESVSDSETNLGVNAGVGYQTGKIQARAGLLLPDIGEAGDAQGIMLSVGFDVAAL